MVQSVRTGEHRPAGVIDATGSEPWWDTYREVITGTSLTIASNCATPLS